MAWVYILRGSNGRHYIVDRRQSEVRFGWHYKIDQFSLSLWLAILYWFR